MDADIRDGWWPQGKPKFPLVLGTDGSGIVAVVGSRVRRLKVGEPVYGYSWMNPKGGFYAEFVAVSADNAAPIPKQLDLMQAGAVPVVGLTALQGIDDMLKLKKGEHIIIHGAGGGVGSMAVQFAKLRKARVLATATGEDGKAFVRSLGADVAVDGANEDILKAVHGVRPKGRGCGVGSGWEKQLKHVSILLRRGGRVAYPNGRRTRRATVRNQGDSLRRDSRRAAI